MIPIKKVNKGKPAIRVEVEQEVIDQIHYGPLKHTGGRGVSTWVRIIILKELQEIELKKGDAK